MKIIKYGYLSFFILLCALSAFGQPSAHVVTTKPTDMSGLPSEVKFGTTATGEWTLTMSRGKIWLFNTDKGPDLLILLSPPPLELKSDQTSTLDEWQIPDTKPLPLQFYVLPYQDNMPVQLFKCSQWLSQERLVCGLVRIPKTVRPIEKSGFVRVR